MLRADHTLNLNGLILPPLIPPFLFGMGTDNFSSASIGADIVSSSNGGGDNASNYGRRDTDDPSIGRGGADMS